MAGKLLLPVRPGLAELIPNYLEGHRGDVEDGLRALSEGDFEHVARLAHIFRSSGMAYGIGELTLFGTHLDGAARDKDYRRCAMLLDHTRRFLSAATPVIVDR